MNINKFTKSKNGMYIISLDDNSKLKIHEDLILKYELLLKKSIDSKELSKILEENRIYEIYEVATTYINKRLRSVKEIRNYLSKKEYDSTSIEDAITLLKKNRFLDDNIYAKSYISDRIRLSMDGPNKIIKDLEENDISISLINELMADYTKELEEERVEKLISKYTKSNKNKGINLLKRNISMNLYNLGYNMDTVNRCLNSLKIDDSSLYKKEYDKEYTKLSKKYSGKELEYRLKQKMYQKGFNNYE